MLPPMDYIGITLKSRFIYCRHLTLFFFFFPDYHSEVPNLMTGMDLETEELSAFVFI